MSDNSGGLLDLLHHLPDPDAILYQQVLHQTNSFTPFPRLPIELQDKIWTISFANHKRTLSVYIDDNFNFSCKHPPPSALSANHESRVLALKTYKNLCGDDGGEGKPRPVYFNPNVDTIFLREVDFMSHSIAIESLSPCQRKALDDIESLRLEWGFWNFIAHTIVFPPGSSQISFMRSTVIARHFRCLRNLTILPDKRIFGKDYFWAGDLMEEPGRDQYSELVEYIFETLKEEGEPVQVPLVAVLPPGRLHHVDQNARRARTLLFMAVVDGRSLERAWAARRTGQRL